MAKSSYALFDNFELKGIWWLPDKPEARVPGTLSFDNEHKIILELQGSFREITPLVEGDLFQPDIILGISDSGHICTLFKNIVTNSQLNFPGIHKTSFKSVYLFIGKHFDKPEEIAFTALQVNFTNIENWLVERPFSKRRLKDTKSGWTLTFKWPAEFNVNLEDLGCTIELTHNFNTGGDLICEAHWKSKAYLKIKPTEPKHFEWYLRVMYDLRNLLTLLIGETTYINYVKAFGDDVQISPDKKSKETIELYFTQKKYGLDKNIYHFHMIITYPRISKNISDIFSLWFAKAQQLRSVYDLFFGTFYNPELYLQFQFLSLMQAIESFHRVTKGGKYLSNEDWQPYRETLAMGISKELDSSHRESLKSRIKYGNEYSLRKRIGELLETLDESTSSLLTPTDKFFTGVVVDTRNYLTHYDDELKDVALKNDDLYWANQRLKILITILLLKEIGIPEDLIVNSMKDNNKISPILKK